MSKLILNSKDYQLPSQFRKMGEISAEIFGSLTSDNQQYVVQSKVSEEVFDQFFLYLKEGQEPEVHIDNLFELQQLSVEFCTREIKELIQRKTAKWREIEAQLEQQGTLSNSKEQEFETKIHDLEQNMQILHEVLQRQLQEIEQLKTELRNQNISNQSNQAEVEMNQTNQIDTKINDIQNIFTANIEKINNEIDEKIENIKEELSNKENQIQSQINQTHEHSTKIEQLKNQMNSLQSILSNTQERINQKEESTNSTLELVNLTINEVKQSYVSKDIFIF